MMKVLFVGAHTDDEVSSAGTLAKLKEKGHEINVATFSFCEASSKALGQPANILEKEFSCSMKNLGLDLKHISSFRYPVRYFPQYRQQILEDLMKLKKKIDPQLVFIPSKNDMHQDHLTISEEGRRAFRGSTILGYESVKTFLSGCHICYSKLNLHHVRVKIGCLLCYKSQEIRPGMSANVRMTLARLRGAQAEHTYAEAFEVMRLFL